MYFENLLAGKLVYIILTLFPTEPHLEKKVNPTLAGAEPHFQIVSKYHASDL